MTRPFFAMGSYKSRVQISLSSNFAFDGALFWGSPALIASTMTASPRGASIARAAVSFAGSNTLSFVGADVEPSWTVSSLSIDIPEGSTASHDLSPYLTNYNPSLHQLSVTVGTLPVGVTADSNNSELDVSGAQVLNENQTVTLRIIDSASADWAVRSSAQGVIQAVALSTQAELDIYGDGTNYNDPRDATLDTSIAPPGQAASAKLPVLNTDGASSGSLVFTFPQFFGNGQTFWVSYRVRVPPAFACQPWNGSGLNKLSITSRSPYTSLANQIANQVGAGRGSNTTWECVIQCYARDSVLSAYHQDGLVTAAFEGLQNLVTPCSSSDQRTQSSINRSVSAPSWTNYPLTGTNPDSGAAWSACENARRQYSNLYSAYSTPGTASFRPGWGDPLSAGMKQFPNEWLTITQRITIGTFDSPNSRRTVWIAREGLPYELVSDAQNITLGGPGPFDGHWLLPYVTNRVAGGRRVGSRTNNITGLTIHSVGNSTPIGQGTLEYVASTGRFRWSGNGESFGPTRGHSVANNKLIFNVEATGATDSYLVVEVNAASLPSSGTVTDSITIADGRADTQINYAEYILSTQAINASGGFAPVG